MSITEAERRRRTGVDNPDAPSTEKCQPEDLVTHPAGKLPAVTKAEKPLADNPVTSHFDFGGPIGAAALIVVMPATVYALEYALTWSAVEGSKGHPLQPKGSFLDARAALYFVAWMAFTAAMYYVPWGEVKEGVELRDGRRLKYPINTSVTFFTVLALTSGVFLVWGPEPLVDIYDRIPGLLTATVGWATLQSIFLYLYSFRKTSIGDPVMLSVNGNSKNAIYDFFIGRELNPRIGGFDLKYFCELRPGLIGWLVLNMAAAAKQYHLFGHLTDAMMTVIIFQLWYVADSQINEECVLTTMDITTDGFGYMLTFGDLVWVPFTYTLQARYLATHDFQLDNPARILIIILHFAGYAIFRGANQQKDAFRSDPLGESSKGFSYIVTKSGSRLLTSGWWGRARHINYLGDWIMGVTWCLPCGIPPFPYVPYFYAVYFAILLVHRERRDDHKCSVKYGPDWDQYRQLVKWRIVPGIY